MPELPTLSWTALRENILRNRSLLMRLACARLSMATLSRRAHAAGVSASHFPSLADSGNNVVRKYIEIHCEGARRLTCPALVVDEKRNALCGKEPLPRVAIDPARLFRTMDDDQQRPIPRGRWRNQFARQFDFLPSEAAPCEHTGGLFKIGNLQIYLLGLLATCT